MIIQFLSTKKRPRKAAYLKIDLLLIFKDFHRNTVKMI